jgi:hypothetical protein
MVSVRLALQLAEALGPVNRWYCSEWYRRPVSDPETLLRYFISRGGAADFARRFNDAMGPVNRWYCSNANRCRVDDPLTLWNYYNCNCRQSRREAA